MQNGENRARKRRRRKGAELVEFAVTVPILFLVVFAAIEFSRVIMIRHTVDNAAYEGARRAIIPGGTAATARTTALDILTATSVQGGVVTTTPAVLTPTTPEITVTVDVPLDENAWITPKYFVGDTMSGSCTLVRERFQTSIAP